MTIRHQSVIPGLGRLKGTQENQAPDGKGSALERLLLAQVLEYGVPEPLREFRFDPNRSYRFDFAWPSLMLAVEVQGGIWTNGRHVRPAGFTQECKKRRRAAIRGWCVLEYTGQEIESGAAAKEIAAVLDWRMKTVVDEG